MAIHSTDLAAILNALHPLLGSAPWRVRLGHGSFVTMDFGRKKSFSEDDKVRERGEYHLWIYLSAWRLDSIDEILAGSEDSREEIGPILEGLEGKELKHIRVNSPSLGLEFEFEDIVLRTFSIYSHDSEHWMLYTPSSKVLVAGPGASWRWDY